MYEQVMPSFIQPKSRILAPCEHGYETLKRAAAFGSTLIITTSWPGNHHIVISVGVFKRNRDDKVG